jgi:hypothetical protein
MVEAAPAAPFEMAEPDLLLELLEVASSSLGAQTSKAFDYQRFLKCSRRAVDAVSGTKRHQSAPSGTESPEKVPNYVLEAFTAAALATEAAALSSTETTTTLAPWSRCDERAQVTQAQQAQAPA